MDYENDWIIFPDTDSNNSLSFLENLSASFPPITSQGKDLDTSIIDDENISILDDEEIESISKSEDDSYSFAGSEEGLRIRKIPS